MAILIEILILIVFSHLDRSLTRAGDSVLTTLVSRHASDAWHLDNVMLDNAVQYSEKAPITYILAVWNFPQNLVLVSAFYEYLKTLSSITYMFGWGGGSWCHLNKQLNTSWHRIEIYRVFARAWRPVRASGGWFVSLARIWLCQMATVDTYF